jgi:hypothetical protein
MYDRISYRNQILQSEPIFLDEYLNEVLHLPTDSKIVSKIILEDRATDTARIIKLLVTWKANDMKEHNKKLFLKLPIMGKQENAFDKWSMHEIDFYRNVNRNNDLPIVKCYDAYIFDDKKHFLLMLDDISSDYNSANDINRNEMGYWLIATESLAKLHSFYWNGSNSNELKLLHGDNKTIEEKIKNYQNALEKFLPYASDYYDNEILKVYHSVLEDAIRFERRSINRREHNNNISIMHGDSHIFNFMFPKVSFQKPLIIDFQFWRMGIATVDIMNLTRVAFPFMNELERHLEVLKHYHTALLEYGVTNYSLDECIYDYYLSAAAAVFGPVFNYFDFGLGHEYWGQGVFDTLNNYKTIGKLLGKQS